MDSLRPSSDINCLNVALLDTPTSPSTSKQDGTKAPLDFLDLTPSQFGITTNSFSVPSKPKDKSRVSQLKARRRSTIGVRGSPETNSLIRYIAKQRLQAPSPTTEHLRLQSSVPRTQTLKQKMAAFQIVMEEVDEERKLELMITPGKSDQKLDCIGAGNTQSDELGSPLGKENRATSGYLSQTTPPPSKRVYRGPLQECEGKIRGAILSVPVCSTQEKVQVFDFKSTAYEDTAFHQKVQHMSLPVLSQQSKAGLNCRDGPGLSSVTKKKRVHFGALLSPEFFDKTLPPSTPLQKGGTPFRQPTSAGSNLRSLLKTPQREASLPQLDFNSPEAAGGSPVLSQSRVLDGAVSSGIVFRYASEDEVPRLVLEENDEVEPLFGLSSAGISEGASPDGLTSAQEDVVTSLFQAEPLVEEQTGTELELVSSPEQQQQQSPPRPLLQQQNPSTSSSPARPRGRKRKQSATEEAAAEGEPQSERRRPSGAVSTSASGKKVPQSEQKRVRFGAPLSPEFFDGTLPPSTPLQKGSTPFRRPASAGAKLCSVLKTPQRNEAPLSQPNFSSPEAGGCSPNPSQTIDPHTAVGSDLLLHDAEQQIPRLLLEEDDEVAAEVKSADIIKDELADSQAPDMTSPRQAEPVLEKQTGAELELVSSPQQPQQQQTSSSPPSPPLPPLQQQEQRDPSTSSSPARLRGRKRKPPAPDAVSESQPVRRPSRSAALSASGKMKDSTGKRRFGSKEVDRSLYGKREFASKNPLLSPIFEAHLISSGGVTPAPAPALSGTSTGKGVTRKSLPALKSQSEAVSDVIAAATRWRQRFCPQPIQESSETSNITEALQATTEPSPEVPAGVPTLSSLSSLKASSTTPRGRGRPEPKPKMKTLKTDATKPIIRRSRGRRSGATLRIDAAIHMTEAQSAGKEQENESGQNRGQIHLQVQSAFTREPVHNHHESGGLEPSPHRSPKTANAHGAAALPSYESHGEAEDQAAMSAFCTQSLVVEGEESDVDALEQLEPVGPAGKRKARASQGRARRRSSRLQLSVVGEVKEGEDEESPGQEEKREVTEEEVCNLPAPSGLEDSSRADVSVEGTHREGLEDGNDARADSANLASWQEGEFSIEDVLRPVASSRRSVRRSLRNRSDRVSKSGTTGLAWVAHTSPDVAKGSRAGRRRTSSRLSISLQPSQLPEETQSQDGPEHEES